LNLDQVREMAEAIALEEIKGPSGNLFQIEMFVHGALCMAISGKCYLSLHEHNQSANRGNCFQVCRRGYTVTDKDREVELDIDNEYIMSPKDLKTIHFLNKLLDAGVSVLKIEGRARSAEYVKTVVSCYNEAIHAYLDGSFSREKIEEWDTRLATVFNRGFWDGYYLGQRLGEWTEKYGSRATLKKVYTGKVTNYFDRIGVAEVLIETGDLKVGDAIVIIGPTTGAIEMDIKELRVDEAGCQVAGKGERCSLPVAQAIRRSDKVYKLVSRS
jgi:putative protease